MSFLSGLGSGVGSGLLSIGGSLLGNSASKKAATKAYNRELAFWRMQNDYNLPENQMERLVDAGLNPNLIYGNGVQNTAAGGVNAQPARQDFKLDFLSGLMAYQNFQNLSETNKQIRQQTQEIEARRKNIVATTQLVREQVRRAKKENDVLPAGISEKDPWFLRFGSRVFRSVMNSAYDFSKGVKNWWKN